ncbi:MAG: hypothetical protein AAF226_12705, partial [Verrucomicrobiota bacterium]
PFGWEGYLAMMVGQKVPSRKSYLPKTEELQVWNNYTAGIKKRASNGLSLRDSLDIIRSDSWQWKDNFYPDASHWGARL